MTSERKLKKLKKELLKVQEEIDECHNPTRYTVGGGFHYLAKKRKRCLKEQINAVVVELRYKNG